MKDKNLASVIIPFFGFGTLAGIVFALIVMAISNTYVTRHDQNIPADISSNYQNPN